MLNINSQASTKAMTYLFFCVFLALLYFESGPLYSGASKATQERASKVRNNQQTLMDDMDKQHSSTAEPTTVLVTGGLGFIGSHVVEELLSRGFKVVIMDDESNGHNHNKAATEKIKDITVVKDYQDLNGLDIQYIIHLAAAISVAESMKDPEKYERINIKGSKLLLDWAKKNGVKAIAAASSAAVYGDPPASALPLKETQPYGGLSPYAKTKYDMEGLLRDAAADGKLRATALRFFNVYGPRQDPASPYSGVISILMKRALAGDELKIFGDGDQTRDFVYVKDIARALLTALGLDDTGGGEKGDSGGGAAFQVLNVCTGNTVTISELADTIVKLAGSSVEIKDGLDETLKWFKESSGDSVSR